MTLTDFHLLGGWVPNADSEIAIILAQDTQGRVLVQLRDDFPYVRFGGQYSLFGGHVDPGEDIETALVRELEEETGLQRDLADFVPFARTMSTAGDAAQHFVYRLKPPVDAGHIRLGEGAGFAFLNEAQIADFPLVEAARTVVTYLFTIK